MGMGQPGRPGMPQGNQAPNQQQMGQRQRPMMMPTPTGMGRMGGAGFMVNQQGTPLTPQGVPSPAMWGTRPNLQGQAPATPTSAMNYPSMAARMAGRPIVQMQQGNSPAMYPQMQQLQIQAQQAQQANQQQPAVAPSVGQMPPQTQMPTQMQSMFGGDDPSMDAWRRTMGMYSPGYMGGSDNGNSGPGVGADDSGDGTGGGTGATYARGGRVRGSMRPMANQMANMGRFGDQSLVHMAPRELRTLQQLNGGRPLPRNPQTGLPEAFGLGDIFSAIGGIVGSFIAPGIGTGIGAGLGSLGGQAIEGKGVDFGKGILSGLLGYGLGSAVSGLGGFASSGAEAAQAASAATADSGLGVATQGAVAAPTSALNVPNALAPTGQALTGGAQSAAPSFTETLTRAGQNLTNPDALWQTFGKGFMKTTMPIVGGAYGLATMPEQEGLSPAQAIQEQQKSSFYRSPAPGNRTQVAGPTTPDPRGYEQTYYNNNRGWTFMADGGRVGYAGGGTIRGLPPAGGRHIRGGGDGLSDTVPAIIDGREPARLSSGEWVAPAHLVSALGNGSTDAGVRQLDGMADRVMKRKYGTVNRRPGPLNARRFMPA